MATESDDLTRHPVAAAVAAAEADLDQVTGVGFWSMSHTEIAETLIALHRLHPRVAALELGIVHHAEVHELGTETGAADTSSYWAKTTRQTRRDAKRRLQLAHAMDHDHEPVRGRDGRRHRVGGARRGDRQGRGRGPDEHRRKA
jgi:hypothetical protein